MIVAKCHNCHTLFSFEEQITKTIRQRPEVPMPPGIEAFSYPSELNIEIKWRAMLSGFLIFFTIFWNLILIPFVVIGITQGEWFIFLVISLHLFIGVALLYFMIATLVNTTYIVVDRYHVSITHKPIPVMTFKDRQVSIFDVQQIFIEKYVASRTNGNPNFAYKIKSAIKNKEPITLMQGLTKHVQARYIEQEIEKFLEIDDQAVEGEWIG